MLDLLRASSSRRHGSAAAIRANFAGLVVPEKWTEESPRARCIHMSTETGAKGKQCGYVQLMGSIRCPRHTCPRMGCNDAKASTEAICTKCSAEPMAFVRFVALSGPGDIICKRKRILKTLAAVSVANQFVAAKAANHAR